MIRLDASAWPAGLDADAGPSLITGAPSPLPLGSFQVPADLFAAPPDDDPVTRADNMRERAGEVFHRHRAIGAFNRELDNLFTNIAEGTDWSEGLGKYDKEIGNLRQKHLAELRTPDDRAAFEQHADAFAAMQRIGLKRALVGRQQADALALLDDQLAYYAGKASAAPNEVFRQMAIDAGERAIAELRDAGYLFPESAEKRKQGFLGLIDGADLEAIIASNPDDAAGILDNPALFPNVDAATRERLKLHVRPAARRPGDPPPPIRTMEYNVERDGPYGSHEPALRNVPTADAGSTPDPQPGGGVGDHEIPLNADSAAPEGSEESPAEGSSAAETQTPGTWQALLGQMLNMDLGRQQGLTPHDLVDAKPLPDELAKYNLKPGEATEANIDELLPLLRADARKLGLDVIVRWDPGIRAPGFAVRPEGSSAHVAGGDGALAKGLNRVAEVAYAIGSMLGLNFGGPASGAVATGARVANALKTDRAANEAIVSAGGAGGPPKSQSVPPVTESITTAAPKASTSEKPAITLTGKELGDFGTDLNAWRKAAAEDYDRIRAQGPANQPALGQVEFTRVGRNKLIHTGLDPDRLKLVPALREIVENGKLMRTDPPSKARSDGIVRFHWLETNVSLDGKTLHVGFHIAEDAWGRKFYNLNHDLDSRPAKRLSPGTLKSDGINLFILGIATSPPVRDDG